MSNITSTKFTGRRRLAAAIGTAALGLATMGALAASPAEPAQAAAPPEVFSGFRNAALISGSTAFTTQLNVPAGSYVIFSKASAFNGASSSHNAFCELRAGNDFDRSFTRIASSEEQTVSNNVVHTFAAAGTVQLQCNDTAAGSDTTLLEFIKVTAVRVNPPISNIQLP